MATSEQEFVKRVPRVDLDSSLRGAEVALIPAPGTHWFLRGRRPQLVSFYRSEDAKGRSQRRIESLTLKTIGRDQRVIRSLSQK